MRSISEASISKIEAFANSFLSVTVRSIHPLPASGNNRAYKISTNKGFILLKEYFTHPFDIRDRSKNEFAFLTYASKVAPQFVPNPIAIDSEQKIAAYEFIRSTAISSNNFFASDIEAAAEFFCLLNQDKFKDAAIDLPQASEAQYSISGHLNSVEGRIKHLQSVGDMNIRFIKRFLYDLSEAWLELERNALIWSKRHFISLDLNLDPENRCISPSDFGFHNALRRENGSIVFIDFEYAGWDDPARMCADFFSQPKVPIPDKYHGLFKSRCLSIFPGTELLHKNIRLMLPIFQAKWCCIIAGVIDPVVLERRLFAHPGLDKEEIIVRQIALADVYLNKLRELINGLY
ncbi:MAG: hypothetical protein WCO61_03045 [Alphaproteobacteria bacterium]